MAIFKSYQDEQSEAFFYRASDDLLQSHAQLPLSDGSYIRLRLSNSGGKPTSTSLYLNTARHTIQDQSPA